MVVNSEGLPCELSNPLLHTLNSNFQPWLLHTYRLFCCSLFSHNNVFICSSDRLVEPELKTTAGQSVEMLQHRQRSNTTYCSRTSILATQLRTHMQNTPWIPLFTPVLARGTKDFRKATMLTKHKEHVSQQC